MGQFYVLQDAGMIKICDFTEIRKMWVIFYCTILMCLCLQTHSLLRLYVFQG